MPSPPFWWERQIFQEIEVTLLSHKITIINPLTQKNEKLNVAGCHYTGQPALAGTSS